LRLADSIALESHYRESSGSGRLGEGDAWRRFVSVITATLSLALVHKVVRISLKRSASEIVRHQSLVNLSVSLSSSMKTLSLFADADASAFESCLVARALPRTTEIEIADRTKTMHNSLLRASEVPLEAAQEMARGLELAEAALDLADGHVMRDVVAVNIAAPHFH
jgi:formiminotetrahydrofolate cyclodeaminase